MKTAQILINKSEKDIIHKGLLEWDVKVEFFTNEENDQLLLMNLEYTHESMLWHLGKAAGHAISCEIMKG